MAKQQTYDATKMGPLSWRQLQLANQEAYANLDIDDDLRSALQQVTNNMSIPNSGSPELNWEGRVQSPIMRNSNGRDYWGKSMWDEQVADANDFYNNLSDLRGQNQPWYAQLGAGLLKGVTTFGTTWLDGTVGLLYGIGAAIGTAFDDNATGWDAAAKIFHNSVSDSLQDFNEFMEEFAPNYKSRDEENNKWYQNMGTMNFWADGLIKNLGFTVGAFYSGGVFTKAIKGVGGLIAAGKAGKAAKAYKAGKIKELMEAGMSAEEAAKAVNPMATATRYTNTLKAIEGARSGTGIAVAGSLFSAVNEGRIEANQVYRDAFTLGNTPEESKGAAAEILAARNRKMQEIEDNPTLLPSEKQALQAQVNANSQKLLAEAEQNAAKAGMLTLGLNIPILTIDNFKMYGRLYSRGFKQSIKQVGNNVTTQELKAAQDAVKNATTKQEKEAAKRALKEAERKAKAAHNARNNARIDDVAENVTDKEGRLAWNEITKGQAAWKGIKQGLMEGNEEMMQAWASGTAGNMTMPEDPDAYYKALTDPNATVKTNDFLTSVTKGFLDSYGNMDRWEEGAIGFLTGILGMPTFGARANSDSNTYLGRGKMIGLSGGFFGEFSNANYLNRLGAESVKNLNAFRDKYKQHAQFLAQSQAFTDAMDGYLQDKNEFAYNNARDNDDYAMIQALAVTGRIDEVKAMLNFKEEDLTDDILDSIANDFTENSNLVDSDGNPKTVDDNGKPLQGAWRDKAGNLMSRTDEGKAEMKAKLLEKQKRLNEEIDDYVASLDSVRAQVNNSLDESQVRELAWLDWKNKQWSRRFQDVQEDQNEAFKTISSAITQALDAKDKNGNPVYTDKDTINKLKELQELADKAVSAKSPMELYTLSALDGNLLHKLYAKVKGEKFDYDVFDIISNYIGDNNLLNTIFESLYDIRQMALAQHQFSEKLKEYTSDPSKLAANRQRIEEERQQAQSVTDDINTRRKLKNMSVKDYMGLSDEDKEKVKAQAKDFDDDDINNIIVYGDEIDEKTEKMLNEVFGDEDTDETTKSLLAEAIAAMKDEAEKPEQITIHSEAYLEWRRNKLNEYKNNGKYDEGLEYLNGLDEYLLRLMSDYSDDDSDFDDEDFDDGEPEDFDDEDVPSVDDFDDDDSTGHDATTSVQSVREKQKKDKKKEEKKKKKEEELTYADELWKRLTDIAPEGKEEVVESTAKPIREKLGKTVNDERKKGVKKIASGVVTTFKAGMFPSDSYKELEQIIGDKALLEKTIIGIINDYIEYINGILAKEIADNKAVIEGDKKKAEEPEEEVRTPVIPESEIDTYAESQHKNRSSVGRDTQKNYWLPRTTQYGIGSTEFSKPKFDKDTGRQLKYWERVKGGEGNYSPKLRAKIVTVGQWLDEHGVFDNVDGALNKTLKGGERGTEIAFTTNQELNDLVANAMWEADNKQGEKPKSVIILMAVGDDLHIVGDMAEPDLKNLGTQEKRLAAFVNDFNKRYGEWLGDSNQDHSKPFVHPMRTKIHQGLVGRMIYNEKKDRNTLNSIFGNGIILGVALRDSDSGKLDVITNPNKSKKDAKTSMENDILQPQNPKAGQPYVVVPSLVSGKYICVPFTIPSLSEVRRIEGHENFGLIRNLNDALAEITSIDFTKDNVDTELIAAKDKLESILNVNLWIEHKDGKLIIKRKVDKKYVQIYAEPVENMRNFAESIITEFEKAGVGFQVDRKKINKGDYNRLIGEIANTNLPVGTEYHTKNDWFTVEPINVESGKKGRIASNIKSTGNNPNASDKIITVTRTAKDKSVTVTVDLENDTVSYTDSKGKLQVVPKSEFGTKENAHKAWAYAIGQAKEIFKEKPNKNTLPYQTKNNDEYFDPVNYRFLASKEEFDALCKERLTLPMAEDTLEADLKKSVGKDITVTITTKSKSGYPIVEIQRTDGENGVYTNKFRVSEEGNIESAAGWASDNPANWEVDNSVTNRGGDTISFTPVLDFYKTLGFTPKPAPTTTTQTTTEQQPAVETKQEQKQQNTTTQEVKQEVEQKEHIKEDFDDSFDVEEASPEVEQAIGEVIQGTNLGLSIDEVFKQNSSLEQLYNSNPQFKDSVDSLRKVMEENKQKEEEQKAREQQIAEEPAKTPDDIAKEYLKDAKDAEYEKMWNALSDEGKKNFIARYAKDSKTFNSKMREIKKFWNKKEGKFKLGGEPKFRVETKQDTTKWNREQEMAWLKKALPQLSNEQRVQVVDGLIKVADSDNPGYAWGQFYRGLITISNEAASGTLYHEAFHAVIDLLMTEDEYNKLFDAAYQVWGNLGMLGLEEKLAEEFRKFVQYGDNAAFVDYDAEDIKTPIIRGIVRLFRKLKALIQGLSNKQIYLNKLFYDINKGKFADRKVQEGRNLQPKFDINERELEDIKKKAIADGTFMKAPNGKPTNLNERQWLQVRTKAFKDWFGDWENNGVIVSKDARTDKYSIYKDGNPIGSFNIDEKRGIIYYVELHPDFRRKGLGKYVYVAANRELNKNGITLKSRPNPEDGNPLHPNAEKIWQNLIKEGLAKKTENGYDMATDNSFSKVVDENGEPLVVYHSNTLDKNYKTVSQIVPNFDLDSKPSRYQVGVSYADFNKLSDKDVATLLSYNYVEFYRDYLIVTEAHFGTTEDRLNAFEVDKRSLKRLRKFHPEIAVRDIENISIPDMVNPFIDNIVTTDSVSDDEELWQQVLNNPKYEGRAKTYFTDKKNLKYSNNFGRATAAVFLNIKHPFDYDNATKQEKENYFRNDFGSDNIKGVKLLRDGYDGATAYLTTRPEYVPFTPNQIKSATDNVGTFSRENNDIRYREVATEEEYKSMVEEMGLSRDSADTFIYNFMTKILNVNPRYKVNEKSDTLSYFYLDDPTIINQQGKARIENLFKKILGKSQGEYLYLDFDNREAFIKSIDEFLADWEQSLIQRVNNPSGNSAYKEKAQTLRKIKLLQSLLNRNLDLSAFTEEEKELIGSIEGKSKRNIGFAIQKLKKQLPVIEQQIERINFINHAMLVQAKNRLLAIHTIENIEDIIKDRLLREYDSYTIKDNTYNEKVLPNRKVVEAIKKVLDQKHREGAAILFDEKESRESNWNELYNRIVTSYPEYKELLDLFHKANPKLKIVVGGNAEMTVQGSELGKFHPKSNTLYLTNESDIFTAIHELAHSATFYGMEGKSKDTESFDSSIDKFMDYIREYIKDIQANPALFSNSSVWGVSMPADIYGFTNASEFIAELFGNPSFQELLDTIPAMEESKFKSLLQQVWDMIADFLNKVFGNNKLSKSALDQAKQLGYVSMSLQEQHIDLIYKQLEKYTNKAQPSISRVKTDDMSVKQYHFQKLMYINLSEEDKEYIKERGMSVRDYSSMNQAEKELFWKCR